MSIENQRKSEYMHGPVVHLERWTGAEWQDEYVMSLARDPDAPVGYWPASENRPVESIAYLLPPRATTDLGEVGTPPLPRGYYRIAIGLLPSQEEPGIDRPVLTTTFEVGVSSDGAR